ncbi:MAG: CHAT domain-containing protein [Candidatus Krumholzibacteriota bacterium]|nr:CHAT domain-containing protein [Candidatus Krumholzibacteriota bacterium]
MKTVRFVFHFLLLAAILGILDWTASPPGVRDPVTVSPRIGALITASRRAEAERRDATDSLTALRTRVGQSLLTVGNHDAELDSLRAAWRRHPDSFALIHLAMFHRAGLGEAFMAEMMSRPALADSTAAGLYIRCFGDARQDTVELDMLLMARDAAVGLPLSERAWINQTLYGALESRRRYPDAIAHLDTMLPALCDAGLRLLEVRAWWNLAEALRCVGRPGDALAASRRCAELAERVGMRYQALSTRADCAQALDKLGRPDLMLAVLNEMERECQREGFLDLRSLALNRLSNRYAFLGEPEAALRVDQEVLRTMAAMGDSSYLLFAILNVADGHMRAGRLETAAAVLDRADTLLARRPEPLFTWTVPSERSLLEGLRGDFTAADSLARLAESLAPERRDSVQEAQRLLNLVDLGQQSGRPDVAWHYLRRLEDYRRLAPSDITGFDAAVEIDLRGARLALETGFPERAAATLAHLAAVLGARPAPVLECQIEELHGLQMESTDPTAALDHYRRALAAAGRTGRPAQASRMHGLLAWALLDRGQYDEALDHAREMDRHLDPDPVHRSHQERRYLEARVVRARGEPRRALGMLDALKREAGRKLHADLALLADVERGRCLGALGAYEAALAAYCEARSRPAVGVASERVVNASREATLATVRLVLARPGLAEGDPDVASLTLWLGGPIGGIAPAAPPGVCCAFIALDDPVSHLWVLTGDDCRREDLPAGTRILEAVTDLQLSLRSGASIHVPAADSLGAWLLSPLLAAWEPGRTLQVLPDRGLRGLPWPALGCDGRPAIERGPVVEIVPESGRSADGNLPGGGALLALAFGPAGAAECRDVAARWPWHSLVIDDPARALAALTDPPPGDWRVLHLAATAILHRGPGGLAAVVFGPAESAPLPLAAIEAMAWDADLVFLSCCAGLGTNGRPADATGSDLAHAFLASGARAVIAAGGYIYDRPAHDLAVAFYDTWREEPSAEQALWHAQRELRADAWPESGYWAHYTLSRRWR